MQIITGDKLVRKEKADVQFIKSLKLNKRASTIAASLIENGMLEAHLRSVVDSYRNGTALQSYLTVLKLHWSKTPTSKL